MFLYEVICFDFFSSAEESDPRRLCLAFGQNPWNLFPGSKAGDVLAPRPVLFCVAMCLGPLQYDVALSR